MTGWLSYHPVRMMSGVSTVACYASVHAVLDAIEVQDDLQLRFLVTEREQRQAANAFSKLSNQGAMRGCVGAIDGWLCPIHKPRRRKVRRVAFFFLGHYQRYGVNVQACVDPHSRFTSILSASPGRMGDSIAYQRWRLAQVSEGSLPDWRQCLCEQQLAAHAIHQAKYHLS